MYRRQLATVVGEWFEVDLLSADGPREAARRVDQAVVRAGHTVLLGRDEEEFVAVFVYGLHPLRELTRLLEASELRAAVRPLTRCLVERQRVSR